MSGAPNGAVICKLDIRTNAGEPTAYNSVEASYEEYCPTDVPTDSDRERDPDGVARKRDASHRNGHRIAPICSDPPKKTTVLCHWCVRSFNTPPVGMPTKRLPDEKFSVAGVYCSLECAVAHNFDVNHASHAAYTRHALCCEMASLANKTVKPVHIYPAPPRAMLDTFGGPLTIEEFRNRDKAYMIVYPLPVVAQVHHAEEMSFSDTITGGRSSRFVPIDEDTIDSFTCGLRRPVVGKRGFKSTLEYMAIAAPSDSR
jgi:hypothetical protein